VTSADAPARRRAEFASAAVDDLRARLERVRWPAPSPVRDGSQGVPDDVMREVVRRWLDGYDMERVPDELARYDNVTVDIDGISIHTLVARSPHADATPLLLLHGWPGGVLEFADAIPGLIEPAAHGGTEKDAFHVIVPSIPGFGFSSAPTELGWGTDRVADALVRVADALGFDRFGTQGGDWGSTLALKIAARHPDRVIATHVNFGYAAADEIARLEPLTEEESALLDAAAVLSGHVAQQSTAPQTIGYALADSPVGQAAWIIDKMIAWADPHHPISIDRMLDFVMLYWMTNSGATSARLYWEGPLGWTGRVEDVPVGYTRFPFDTRGMSERMARTRFGNLVHYAVAAEGGHFAALEQPAAFVQEVRRTFRAARAAEGAPAPTESLEGDPR
jgi:pimeloyl-ACP methyl ester carboxylesterase